MYYNKEEIRLTAYLSSKKVNFYARNTKSN